MEEKRAITRSMEEITASARLNMQDMIHRAIALGQDCIDAKEQLPHGKFLPWLKELGLSSSTASNYMRVAREIAPGSRLAAQSYSKALALLSAPPEDREALAEETEGQSAAEVRRLIEERNRAAEAANAETARANNAEKAAEQMRAIIDAKNKEIEDKTMQLCDAASDLINAKNRAKVAEQNYNQLTKVTDKLRADLLTAENNRVEVEKVVEKVPEDYERIKRQLENAKRSADDLIEAAAAAEERAAAAEAELDAVKNDTGTAAEPAWKILRLAVARLEIDIMPILSASPAELARSAKEIKASLGNLRTWADSIDELISGAMQADGAVVIV